MMPWIDCDWDALDYTEGLCLYDGEYIDDEEDSE